MAAEPSGQDVSQRIRNAIRSKLVDIGCYVDDELPDYVMVMIANKKTKEQMRADLELFLGEYCTSFCDWLHQVLDHLQRYAREGKRRLELFDDRNKLQMAVGSSEDEVDLHPNADEARDFPDFDLKDNNDLKRRGDSKKSRSPLRKIEQKTKKRLKDRVEEVAKEVKKKDESKGKGNRSESSRQRIEMVDDKTQKDASGDEQQSLPKKKRLSPAPRGVKTRDKDRKDDKLEKKRENVHSDRKKLPSEKKEAEKDRHKERDKPRKEHSDRSVDLKNRALPMTVRSGIKSTIAAKGKDSDSDDYEEYDPAKPQLRSIAKVAPRKKLMAKDSLEKNKLLAKAIMDANNSIQQGCPPKKTGLPPMGSSQPKRNIRDRLGAYVTDAIASRVAMVQRFHEMPPSLGDEDEDDENIVSNDRLLKGSAGEDLRFSLRKGGQDKRKLIYGKKQDTGNETTSINSNKSRDNNITEEPSVPIENEPDDSSAPKSAPEVSSDIEKLKPTTKVVAPPQKESAKNVICRNGMIVKPSPLLKACGMSETKKRKIEAPDLSTVESARCDSSPKKMKFSKADQIPLKSLDDLIKPSHVDSGCKPPRRRCHFDPSCTNPTCSFAHPGQPCTSFPYCGLKASVCNFRHPPCYYDKTCTNRTCQFNHKHDGMPTPEDAKPAPCKYFPNCSNTACPFYHPPIPCKFGLRCQALTCPFVHPQKSTVAKLKWVAH